MRIIHLASGDLWAGAEVQLFHLALNLKQKDEIDLLIVLLNDGQLANELRSRGVDVFILDEAKLSFFKIVSKFNKICKQFRPDVIHTHRVKENLIGGVITFLLRCKSVRTVHGAPEFSGNLKTRIISFIDNFVAKFFQHKVIAVSHELKEKLAIYSFRKKIEVIENCIDIEHVKSKAIIENDYRVNSEQFNIAFVGRFVAVKRTDLFIDIIQDVNKRYPDLNIQFHMFGDGPLWEQAKTSITKLRLMDNVNLAGFVDNSASYIKKMDLLLITSDHEGLPMTLLEAMALKVAVMSRNLVTIKHVLCGGDCGYILSSDTASIFSNEIAAVIRNKENYNSIKLRAYNAVVDNYSIQVLIERYVGLYKGLLS